jgi:hypothetical protein
MAQQSLAARQGPDGAVAGLPHLAQGLRLEELMFVSYTIANPLSNPARPFVAPTLGTGSGTRSIRLCPSRRRHWSTG